MTGRIFANLACALAMLLASGTAGGEETEITGWIDQSDASSECLGDARSLVCAVETAIACRVRRDDTLCGRMRMAVGRDDGRFSANPDPAGVVETTAAKYRIRVDESDSGDLRQVGVSIRYYGKYGLNWPEQDWRRLVYYLHRENGSWHVNKLRWPRWLRYIGSDTKVARCIGTRDTPVCAVETNIACRVGGDEELCAIAGHLEPEHFRPKGAKVVYFTIRIRRWEPPGRADSDPFTVTVLVAESTELPSPGEEPGSAYVFRPSFLLVNYTLEKRGGEWVVVSRAERP